MKLPDVAVFAPCLSARPLLSCLLFVHRSVCSSHGRWLVARPSAARRCSVYSSLTGLSTRLSRVCLFESWSWVLPVVGLLARHWSMGKEQTNRASVRVVVARLYT